MPFNLLKLYPHLLEITHFTEPQRNASLRGVFNRDVEANENFQFYQKVIRPVKTQDGESAMDTLFRHLTTKEDKDEKGKKTGSRSFEVARSERLHWLKHHIDLECSDDVEIFSCEERDQKARKDRIRTYVYNKTKEYVIILEPQRSGRDYYLLTAYHVNEKIGQKQIKSKLKNKLPDVR